jgi:ribosome-associated toxin RatA of RatAB toxin-antitoxin module
MRQVTIRIRTAAHDATEVYSKISDFARYAELTDTVREVLVQPPQPDGSIVSEWTVAFRNGLLRWTERDTLDPAAGTIAFTQVRGDFETFEGMWRVESVPGGTQLTFAAAFDLGIPTLADILDPVAEATLRSNILCILEGLLGPIEQLPTELDDVRS